MLVQFAGKDPDEKPFSASDTRHSLRRSRAYDMFNLGYDTTVLAKRFQVTEATALRWVSIERSKRLGLPSPYEGAVQ